MSSLFANSQARRKRASIPISSENLVEFQPLRSEGEIPLLIQPCIEGVHLVDWAKGNKDLINKRLVEHGALLFRGFNLRSPQDFSNFIRATSNQQMDYVERSSPRTRVTEHIYTSTDYPADQSIFPHNEHSYSLTYPSKIYFFCSLPAQEGGETPIVDCRRLGNHLDKEIVDRFSRHGWMYMRNFGEGIGLPWQTVFQTDNKQAVQAYCRKNKIAFQWKSDDRLRTSLVRPVMATHPKSSQRIWFNHATFFHISSLQEGLGSTLRANYGDHDLPNNTFYGDGSVIEDGVVEHLRQAYQAERISFSWQKGDLLLLDNMLVAHSRNPFQGDRKVLVGMADPQKREDC